MPSIDLVEVKWYIGEIDPHFIFAQVGDEPSYLDDLYIGMMKSTQIAKEVVEAHNAHLESR